MPVQKNVYCATRRDRCSSPALTRTSLLSRPPLPHSIIPVIVLSVWKNKTRDIDQLWSQTKSRRYFIKKQIIAHQHRRMHRVRNFTKSLTLYLSTVGIGIEWNWIRMIILILAIQTTLHRQDLWLPLFPHWYCYSWKPRSDWIITLGSQCVCSLVMCWISDAGIGSFTL